MLKTCGDIQKKHMPDLPGDSMLWAWEVVGRQSLEETWCIRMGNGESRASGVKESALNVWHAILLRPLPSDPRGSEMWSVRPSLCPFLIYFLVFSGLSSCNTCFVGTGVHLSWSAVTTPFSSCPALPQPRSHSCHRAAWEKPRLERGSEQKLL